MTKLTSLISLASTLILAAAFISIPQISKAAVSAAADEAAAADELTLTVTASSGETSVSRLTDGSETTYTSIPDGGAVDIAADAGISSLYIVFDRIYGEWTLADDLGVTIECGQNGYLHEFVDVAELFGRSPRSLTLRFDGGKASIAEIHAFGDGEPPEWVQIWEPPCGEADLLLATTHVDDEQLFFAGVLPYYAGERGYDVQVVYFTDPFQYHDRPHEQLNGLWTVGVRHYPVCGDVVDQYSESTKDAYANAKRNGMTKDDMVRFQIEMIRRFKPHVIVGHDFNGEYGHGQHMINSETLAEALPLAADASFDPESAALYGVWDTPKTYIHLYGENKIVMNWDEPLDAFGGRTAFEMTQEGFMCHKSQHWTWFYGWIYGKNGNKITKASEIKTHSPCEYGLYRTTVGYDTGIGDMFENIPMSYAQIAEAERLEALAKEESERLESERLESERLESERIESERLESERLANAVVTEDTADTGANERRSDRSAIVPIVVVAAAVAAAAVMTAVMQKSRKR